MKDIFTDMQAKIDCPYLFYPIKMYHLISMTIHKNELEEKSWLDFTGHAKNQNISTLLLTVLKVVL